jgi:hypothetical protein
MSPSRHTSDKIRMRQILGELLGLSKVSQEMADSGRKQLKPVAFGPLIPQSSVSQLRHILLLRQNALVGRKAALGIDVEQHFAIAETATTFEKV